MRDIVPKNCEFCEFNVCDKCGVYVCAARFYGEPISDCMLVLDGKECSEFELAYWAFEDGFDIV